MKIELEPHYDVVICGAGPCGATMANLLGMYGVATLLIDVEPDIVNIPRAVGMCDEGSRILNAAGVLKHAPVDFKEISRTNFSNAAGDTVFHFDMGKRINSLAMQRTFYQPELESSIRNSFERFDCVCFSPATELIRFSDLPEKVDLELSQDGERKNVSCRYLVGCDGASSPIRKQMGIGFGGKTYRQDWLIIDVANNPVQSDEIFFSIDPTRPGITLPLPRNKRRWEFVVKPHDNVDALFSEENLGRLLSPWGDLQEMQVERKAIYTFHARVATQFTKGNVFLAGDAAHITPPFAGQGMMAGLRDAYNLSWKLAGVINGQLTPGVLASYDTDRVQQCKQVIRFAEVIGGFVLPQSKFKTWVRDSLIKILTLTGLYSKDSGMNMDKIPNHINGSLLRNFWVSKRKGTGVWFPQYPLSCNQQTRLSDDWMNEEFSVVGWEHDALASVSSSTRSRWESIGGKNITIAANALGSDLVDVDGVYAEFFNKNNTVVIRPDKMIVIACKTHELDGQLSAYLDKICSARLQVA